MNPKVSPSAKNLAPLPGKKRVFRKPTTGIPSQIKESGISSHIKDGQKATIANYDLSLLDVVPAAGKDNHLKTKHVHFLPEEAYITGKSADVKQTKSNIGQNAPTSRLTSASSTPQSGLHRVKKHNGCTSGRSRTNSQSDSAEVLSGPPNVSPSSTRRGSVSSPGSPVAAMVQRSNSLPVEHNKHGISSDCATRKHHFKSNSPMARPKEKRSLPPTPAPAAATATTTMSSTRDANNFPAGAMSSTRDANNFPAGDMSSTRDANNFPAGAMSSTRDANNFPAGAMTSTRDANNFPAGAMSSTRDATNFPARALQQKTTLPVSSNTPVFLSPTYKNKSCSRNTVALNSSIPKRTERKTSHPEPREETNSIAEKPLPPPETAVPHSNVESYKRDNSLTPPTKHKHSRSKSKLAGIQGQTTLVNGDVVNGCSPTKQQWRSQETIVSASGHNCTGGTQLEQRERFANVENKDSTNPESHVKLHTSSHKHLDSTNFESHVKLHTSSHKHLDSTNPESHVKPHTSSHKHLDSINHEWPVKLHTSSLKHLDSTNHGSPVNLHTSSHKHLDCTNHGSPVKLHTSSHKHLDCTNHGSPVKLPTSSHKHLDSINHGSPVKLHTSSLKHLDSSNPGSSIQLNTSSHRLLEHAGNGYRCTSIAGDQTLASSSSPSPSLNSLSKEVMSAGMYTLPAMSLTARTKRSQPGRLTDDQRLLFPFSELSSSSVSVSSSVSTSSSQPRSRRSPSCFGTDCVFGPSLGCMPAKQVAHPDNQPAHQLIPPSTCKDRVSRLSDLAWLPGLLFDDPAALKVTNHSRPSAKARKQSIAASYQLDQCWFCGRPMPGLGASLSVDLEQPDKLVDLERRLAEALSEKAQLLEEQSRLKESETQARQQARQLERQLQENRLTEKEVPVTEVLSTPSKDLDLRAYMESLGHELDTCQHVLVTRRCCRGFLHKMGGHFRLWRRRWFVFDCGRKLVSYFTDKTEKKSRGTLSFQTIQEVYMDQPGTVKSPDPKLTLCVKTYHRTFYLMAPSTAAMTIWIDVLLYGAQGYKGGYES